MGHWIPDQFPLVSWISPCSRYLCSRITSGPREFCPGIPPNLCPWVTPANHWGTESVPCRVEATGISPGVKTRVYSWDGVSSVWIDRTWEARAWGVSWVLLHRLGNGVVPFNDTAGAPWQPWLFMAGRARGWWVWRGVRGASCLSLSLVHLHAWMGGCSRVLSMSWVLASWCSILRPIHRLTFDDASSLSRVVSWVVPWARLSRSAMGWSHLWCPLHQTATWA